MKKKIIYQYKNFIKIYKFNKKNKYINVKDFHRIELNDATMVIIQNIKSKKFLLLKEYRLGFDKVSYGLPGGFVDKGEKPLKTIKRECNEELGIDIKEIKKVCSYVRNGNYYGGSETIFSAKTNIKKINTEEKVSYYWVTKKRMINLVKKGKFGTPGLLAAILFYFYFN